MPYPLPRYIAKPNEHLPHPHFDQIYRLAKQAKNNKEALVNLTDLLRSCCIDINNIKGHSPAGLLAAEGERLAAETLRKLGANVNFIARGAAFGKQYEYACYLYVFFGAHIDYIAWGAAAGGDYDCAETLRLRFGANVDYLASGVAFSGGRNYCDRLRNEFKANVNGMAGGAAMGGQHALAEYFRLVHHADVHLLGRAAAACDSNYAETLRIHYGAHVHFIAQGAATLGAKNYAQFLLKQGANVNYIAAGSSCAGNREHAEYWRSEYHVSVTLLAQNAATGGQLRYVEDLQTRCARGFNQEAFLPQCLELNFANKKITLHSLAFINDDKYREKLAKYLNKFRPFKATALLPKAKKIADLRYKYNYDQCLALGVPELLTWYLQGATLVREKRLAPQVFLSIATYLSPLTYTESRDLYKNFRFESLKKLVIKDIGKIYYSHSLFCFFKRDQRAKALLQTCKRATTSEELISLLENEKNPSYNAPIEKHIRRLR